MPQRPAVLSKEQASPQPCYTLQPQDAQSQICKILKQHFLMNWTYVKSRTLANQFFHNYQKTEDRERNATNFYCSHRGKKSAAHSWSIAESF